LQERYAKPNPDPSHSQAKPKPECVFTMINLLRCAPGKPEVLLSEKLQESLRLVRPSPPTCFGPLPTFTTRCRVCLQNVRPHGELGEQRESQASLHHWFSRTSSQWRVSRALLWVGLRWSASARHRGAFCAKTGDSLPAHSTRHHDMDCAGTTRCQRRPVLSCDLLTKPHPFGLPRTVGA
jgi:hypothetical protein